MLSHVKHDVKPMVSFAVQYAKPLTIDFGRDPREPFSTPVEGQEAEITSLFSTADELAARAPATCSSEFLLYADTAVRIPGPSMILACGWDAVGGQKGGAQRWRCAPWNSS